MTTLTVRAEQILRESMREKDNEIARLKFDLEQFRKDAQRLYQLRTLMGFVQDGSHTTVAITQDDATMDFELRVGRMSYYGPTLEQAIDNSKEK